MKNILFLVAGLFIFITGCKSAANRTTSNSLHSKEVPAGSMNAITMAVKTSKLSEQELQNWPHADLLKDSIPGISLAQAYEFLEDKTPDTILVGIIDSGIDISHEDLKEQVWTNPGDPTQDHVDDDENGYTDDVHGWNFLGGKQGEPAYARLEITRIYADLSHKFKGKELSEIPESEKTDFERYLSVKENFEKELAENKANFELYAPTYDLVKSGHEELTERLQKDNYTLADISELPDAENYRGISNLLSSGQDIPTTIKQLEGLATELDVRVNKNLNPDYNGRKTDDDPEDITDVPYGNPLVVGSTELEQHGTHVAGIMLADRSNDLGVKGVTNSVKLIVARATPRGDERDKDVALAIRYMADHGVRVINMSFGKAYTSHPEWVYEAIQYAEAKDVLIVKAAGNDGVNIDEKIYYPTDTKDNVNEISDNVISIGAITPYFDERMMADYSNYGKKNVDLFAPGSDIYSTIPNNKYDYKQGTSMASPVVAGVAAMIRSYYPQLSASQVKHILMNSGLKVDMDVLLPKSNGEKKIPFSEVSRTGRILNAFEAVKMADAMINE